MPTLVFRRATAWEKEVFETNPRELFYGSFPYIFSFERIGKRMWVKTDGEKDPHSGKCQEDEL